MSIMGEKEDAIDYWTKVVETKKMLGSDVKPIWCHPWSPEESHVHLPRKEAEEYRQNFIKVGLNQKYQPQRRKERINTRAERHLTLDVLAGRRGWCGRREWP